MSTIFAIPTLLGQQALAAAIDITDPVPVTIAEMVIGDGNGNAVIPLENQTALINLRATAPIEAVVRQGSQATFNAVFGEDVGPFFIREAGLLDDAGRLLFVASTPLTEKLTPSENTSDILDLGLIIVVSETAQVTLLPPPSSQSTIAQALRTPFLAVDSSVTAPPVSPIAGATHLVLPGATGAFAGQVHSIAQWTGSAWVFRQVPVTHLIGRADTNQYFRRTASGWDEVYLPSTQIDRALLYFHGLM